MLAPRECAGSSVPSVWCEVGARTGIPLACVLAVNAVGGGRTVTQALDSPAVRVYGVHCSRSAVSCVLCADVC